MNFHWHAYYLLDEMLKSLFQSGRHQSRGEESQPLLLPGTNPWCHQGAIWEPPPPTFFSSGFYPFPRWCLSFCLLELVTVPISSLISVFIFTFLIMSLQTLTASSLRLRVYSGVCAKTVQLDHIRERPWVFIPPAPRPLGGGNWEWQGE